MKSVRVDSAPEIASLNKNTIPSMTFHSTNHQERQVILLGTARILIADASGKYCSARAVIDTGSQTSAITGSLASRLGLQVTRFTYQVIGISFGKAHVLGRVKCTIAS